MMAIAAETAAPVNQQQVPSRSSWLRGLILVSLATIIYVPALGNAFIAADVPYAVTSSALRSGAGIGRIWLRAGASPEYAPITHSSLWLEHQLWGTDPRGYHAVTLVLHIVTALLLWRLLFRLGVPGAWWAAVIFALHPAVVENVAWVGGRGAVLSCLLAIATMLVYLRFSPLDEAPSADASSARHDWLTFLFVLALYAAAMLSSALAIGVPAILLVIVWWKHARLTSTDVAWLLPLLVVGAALAALSVAMRQPPIVADGLELSVGGRLLLATEAFWLYPLKLLSPYPLDVFSPHWSIDAAAYWQYVFPIGALAVVAILWLARSRVGRGAAAGATILLITLLPVLGVIGSAPLDYAFFAEHFQYPAVMVIIALAVAGIVTLGERLPEGVLRLAPLGAAAVLLVLASMAFLKTRAFAGEIALEQEIIAHDPGSWLGRSRLASHLAERRDFEAAINQLRPAIDILQQQSRDYPDDLHWQAELAAAEAGLGDALLGVGARDEALEAYRRALDTRVRLAGAEPDSARRRDELAGSLREVGLLLRNMGRGGDAAAALNQAVELGERLHKDAPDERRYAEGLARGYAALGLLEQTAGNLKAAEYSLRRAITLGESLVQAEPDDEATLGVLGASYLDLGQLVRRLGRPDQAAALFDKAVGTRKELLQSKPTDEARQEDLAWAYSNVAAARLQLGLPTEAMIPIRKAIDLREKLAEIEPNNERSQNNLAASFVDLGILLRDTGQSAQALPWFDKSIAIRQPLAAAAPAGSEYSALLAWSLANRGTALLVLDRTGEAAQSFRDAVALRERIARDQPDNTENDAALAWSYANWGQAELVSGKLDDAKSAYRHALDLRSELFQKTPTVGELKHDLALSHRDLGNTELALGHLAEAIESYHAAIELHEQMAVDNATSAAFKANLALDLALCADALASDGQWSDSAAMYKRALRAAKSPWQMLWRTALVELAADDTVAYQATCGELVTRCGDRLTAEMHFPVSLTLVAGANSLGDPQRVLGIVQRAADADPENTLLGVMLGAAEYRAGMRAQARATLARALPQLDTIEADTPDAKNQILVARLFGETLLARAFRERTGREITGRQAVILRDLMATPQAPRPQSQTPFPAWAVKFALDYSKRELEDLGVDTDETGN